MKRKIIHIDQDKCNGCRLCVDACHEGAIQMIDNKATLVSDKYCDGLGDCLPVCPTDAIKMVEREADPFDEEAVKERMEMKKKMEPMPCGCPGTHAKKIQKKIPKVVTTDTTQKNTFLPSQLNQWPIQLRLVNPNNDYFEGANLLVAADCTAFSYGNFHEDFIKDHITVIGCPKLDDNNYNVEKLTAIIKNNNIKSIKVIRMEVPCCTGMTKAVKEAMLNARKIVDYKEVIIGIDGNIR
ncbi:MAG: 4Fe-4S binding protein [Anaeromicrobium sp.]|jgi:ferredoxin|uniref:ATP-binding protein n=1 Tax=Anaeromicrobium sp. TaxID=1929132 RepID=UPI0025CC0F6B|nr:4Fe-4S binding protein [Anaeromicrobium sp.]MCT4595190.1 4Fe-4S binding protein [Anaeromicrobium sp.]